MIGMSPLAFKLGIPLNVIKGCIGFGHVWDLWDRKCDICKTPMIVYEAREWELPLEKQERILNEEQLAEWNLIKIGYGTFPIS